MAELTIKDIQDRNIWDRFIDDTSQGTIFHQSRWLDIISNHLKADYKIYGCFKNEELVGGCSFFPIKKTIKTAMATTTMTPYGGLVLKDFEHDNIRKKEMFYHNLADNLIKEFRMEKYDYIQLVCSPDLADIRPFLWNKWTSKVYYTYIFPLDANSFDDKISKDARWTVNKAKKSGVFIEKSEDIDIFYDLFEKTYENQGLKTPASKEFIANAYKALEGGQKIELWLARLNGKAVSAELIILDDKRAYRWSAASDKALRSSGATSYLLYHIFRHLKDLGYQEIDLMAANTPHLAKFISSFNPALVPYYIIEYKTRAVRIIGEILRKNETRS